MLPLLEIRKDNKLMVTTDHIHNSVLVTDPDLSARHYTTNYTEDFTEDDSYLSVMTADFTTFLQ